MFADPDSEYAENAVITFKYYVKDDSNKNDLTGEADPEETDGYKRMAEDELPVNVGEYKVVATVTSKYYDDVTIRKEFTISPFVLKPVIVDSFFDYETGEEFVERADLKKNIIYGPEEDYPELTVDDLDLIDAFNAGLANIKTNGKYDEIIAKYLGEAEE